MLEIAQKARADMKAKPKKKQSKRTAALQKIIKEDTRAEVETTQKLMKRKNVLQKMEGIYILQLLTSCLSFPTI